MSDTNLFLGHGEAWIGKRNSSGNVYDFAYPLPEVDELSISLASEVKEHDSKRYSLSATNVSIVTKLTGTGKLITTIHDPDLLALFGYGAKSAVAGGSFLAAAAIFPTGVVVGQRLPIPGNRKNISSLVIKDSAGSPATLTLGTHYQIEDAAAGIIKFLNLGSFTQPFTAAGTEGASTKVSFLTQRIYEQTLRYKGINVADGDKACGVEVFKIQIEPAKDVMLISEDFNKYEIAFKILQDTTKTPTTTSSQYFEYIEDAAGQDAIS